MKFRLVLLLVVCGLLTACDHRSDGLSASDATTSQVQMGYEKQFQGQQEQFDAYDKQARHADEQLQAQNDMQKRANRPLDPAALSLRVFT